MRFVPIFAFVAVTCSGFMSGCGHTETDEVQAAIAEPTVDPRFATAESLLQHYNSISTREPVDSRAMFDMLYAENDTQRRWLDATRRLAPIAELDYAMFQKFNQGWAPSSKKPMLAPDQPATMTKVEAQRAEAKYIDSDGDRNTLLLVKIGDQWWVSGYTAEYRPKGKFQQDLKQIEQLGELVAEMAAAAPAITAQVRDGTIKTAEDARRELMQSVLSANPPASR